MRKMVVTKKKEKKGEEKNATDKKYFTLLDISLHWAHKG